MRCLFCAIPKPKILLPLIILTSLGLFFLISYSYEPVTGYVDKILDKTAGNATLNNTSFEDLTIYSGPQVNYSSIEEEYQEKFLTYLPHSGFHNQRISLENAIFLAWATNRTLVIPPIIFGAKIPYQTFSLLANRLSLIGKEVLPDCSNETVANKKEACEVKRNRSFRTLVKWDQVMDLSFAKEFARTVQRSDFNQSTLFRMVNVTDTKQVYVQPDKTLYDFEIFDNPNANLSQQRFQNKLLLSDLKLRREKLMYFGSIFSSQRIVTELSENRSFFDQVRKHMIIGNPVMLGVVEKIVDELGGLGSFVGIYLKIGDGKTLNNNTISTINNITKQLIDEYAPEMKSDIKLDEAAANDTNNTDNTNNQDDLEDNLDDSEEDPNTLETPIERRRSFAAGRGLQASGLVAECQSKAKPTQNDMPIIYIATDASRLNSSLSQEAFKEIFSIFPCVFFIGNFSDQLNPIDSIRNPSDNSTLSQYLLPLVDLNVVASGQQIISSTRGAASNYAARLHLTLVGTELE
ncbi:14449_t:CDS:1 [Ambispora leptoticha]|uniref:14449_t:CDS:1 n=1 Tax=Ambispora leptoticha TaxID=144679 RepID=A0A9N8WE91_9GLOM|nr:14449_t:CDS:1 [Ambispora leptoticha]